MNNPPSFTIIICQRLALYLPIFIDAAKRRFDGGMFSSSYGFRARLQRYFILPPHLFPQFGDDRQSIAIMRLRLALRYLEMIILPESQANLPNIDI